MSSTYSDQTIISPIWGFYYLFRCTFLIFVVQFGDLLDCLLVMLTMKVNSKFFLVFHVTIGVLLWNGMCEIGIIIIISVF